MTYVFYIFFILHLFPLTKIFINLSFLKAANSLSYPFQNREARAARTRRERHPRKKKVWECSDPKCQMKILPVEKPERKWGDGHVCRFRVVRERKRE